MLIRSLLFAGMTWTVACAARPVELQSSPEPTLVELTADLAESPPSERVYDPHGPPRDVVYTEPGELPQLFAGDVPLPLKRTDVRAHLRGNAAEVVVTQRFVNAGDALLEAVYTFPLPENSAVTDMRMVLGQRVIASQVRERGEARRVYDDARETGHTAALLEQERPNVFTQSVANIPPGETIDVELRYTQTLSYDAGEYEFVFPTVVGPRYLPARVTDAARISPPVLGHGRRSGHDLFIAVTAEAGSPIAAWSVPGHAVDATTTGDRLHVELARRDELANRDFVLRYRSAGARPVARLFIDPADARGGHFMLVVEPPRLDVDALVGQRELVFVVDVSGSMTGAPLSLAKAAVREALAGMRPVDTFDVVVFSGASARLFGAPRPASAANLRSALELIDGLQAGGGTEMADAVRDSLLSPVAPGRHRYVSFFTDGYTGEEARIARDAHTLVAQQRAAGRRARVFGVGIGASPNSELIAGLSQAGEGLPLYIRGPADVSRALARFQRTTDAPVLTDVDIDWGSLGTRDVYPDALPDLFASHPLVLHGRYTGAAPSELRLRGQLDGRAVSLPIVVTTVNERGDALARLWARARVDALELVRDTTDLTAVAERARADILEVGLRHHLVTAYTSLVAVDNTRVLTGPQVRVHQPVEPPQGYQHVPMGGISQDFTAVLDVSPTASRDSAGVRIAGTSGAAPKYVIDGANSSDSAAEPRHLVDGANIERTAVTRHSTGVRALDEPPSHELRQLERAIRAGTPGPRLGPARVEPRAHVRVRGVRVLHDAVAILDTRKRLQAALPALERCFVDAPASTYRLRRKLTLTLQLGPDGAIVGLGMRGAGGEDPDLQSCLHDQLGPIVRVSAGPHSRLEIDLTISMQY